MVCSEAIDGGSDSRILAITLAEVFPSKAFLPVAISWTTAPNAKISVRASISFCFALDLLGRHVLQSAENRPFARDGALQCRELRIWNGRNGFLSELRRTEVEELCTGLGQHDISGFQIAVCDAFAMRLVQRIGNLDRELQYLLDRQRTSLQIAARASRLRYIPSPENQRRLDVRCRRGCRCADDSDWQ